MYTEHYFKRLIGAIQGLDYAQVERAVDLVEAAWQADRQIITMGNGGSAATASHIICDWNKGISYGRDKRMRGLCLNDNIATLMAYANDVSYECIFVEPLKNFLRPGDLVIGFSGSGNSPNVLNAIKWANEHGGVTLGVCGFGGGKLKELAKHALHVNIHDMQIVEDLHMSFGHIVMQRLCGYGADGAKPKA